MKFGPGLSFSWKRALGVTKAKRRVSKKTGIPMSRGERRNELDLIFDCIWTVKEYLLRYK